MPLAGGYFYVDSQAAGWTAELNSRLIDYGFCKCYDATPWLTGGTSLDLSAAQAAIAADPPGPGDIAAIEAPTLEWRLPATGGAVLNQLLQALKAEEPNCLATVLGVPINQDVEYVAPGKDSDHQLTGFKYHRDVSRWGQRRYAPARNEYPDCCLAFDSWATLSKAFYDRIKDNLDVVLADVRTFTQTDDVLNDGDGNSGWRQHHNFQKMVMSWYYHMRCTQPLVVAINCKHNNNQNYSTFLCTKFGRFWAEHQDPEGWVSAVAPLAKVGLQDTQAQAENWLNEYEKYAP